MTSRSLNTLRGIVEIREAGPTDAIWFRDLRLEALLESPTAFPTDYSTSADRPLSFWEERLKTDEMGTLFFAEHGNQLIGMTGIRRGESPKTKHSGHIWGVYVRPAWRGLRIADALIEACISWSKQNNICIVKLGVLKASRSAVRCYERCGFTTYGTEPRGIFFEGKYYDGYLMFRLLEDS